MKLLNKLFLSNNYRWVAWLILPALVIAIFQNCGAKFNTNISSSKLNHPVNPRYYDTGITLKVANRFLMASTFKDLFLPASANLHACSQLSNTTDKATCNTIRTKILLESNLYSGNCGYSEGATLACSSGSAELGSSPTINVAREAGRINACEELLAKDRSISFMLSLIPNTKSSVFEESKVEKLVSLFYIGYKPNGSIIESLLLVSDQYSTEIDKWRFIGLALCKSPGWQVH